MDTLTHALSGALLARATAPTRAQAHQLPLRARLLTGFVAAAFPDSDFVARWIDPLTYLTSHRGITHSVLMLPAWALLLSIIFMWMVRGRYPVRAFFGICALGIGIHIAGDVITAFGTRILAPVSGWRAALPTTFIIDLIFTGIIVAGLIAARVLGNGRLAARAGLAMLVAYVGLQWALQQQALDIAERYAAEHGLESASVHALPQPFSPFNWMLAASDDDFHHTAYISLWRDAAPPTPAPGAGLLQRIDASYQPVSAIRWHRIPRYGESPLTQTLAREAWGRAEIAPFRDFSLLPAVYRIDDDPDATCVWFNDLRFTMGDRIAPFLYGLCRANGSPDWRVYRLLGDGQRQAIGRG